MRVWEWDWTRDPRHRWCSGASGRPSILRNSLPFHLRRHLSEWGVHGGLTSGAFFYEAFDNEIDFADVQDLIIDVQLDA